MTELTIFSKEAQVITSLSCVRKERLLMGNKGLSCVYMAIVLSLNSSGAIFTFLATSDLVMACIAFACLSAAAIGPVFINYQYLLPVNAQVSVLLEESGKTYEEARIEDEWARKVERTKIFNLTSWYALSQLTLPVRYYYRNIHPQCEISKEKFETLRAALVGVNTYHDMIYTRKISKLGGRLDASRKRKIREVVMPILTNENL